MKKALVTVLATFFYSGLSPKAPGTAGSFLAIVLLMAVFPVLSPLSLLLIVVFLYWGGVWASHYYMLEKQRHDPGEIVIDEAAGIALTALIAYPYIRYNTLMEWFLSAVTVFVWFRFFDILKPWPICFFDKKVKGAHGVMLDDIVAGIFAGIFSYLSLYLIFKYGY